MRDRGATHCVYAQTHMIVSDIELASNRQTEYMLMKLRFS